MDDFAKRMVSRFVLTFEFEALRRVQGFDRVLIGVDLDEFL